MYTSLCDSPGASNRRLKPSEETIRNSGADTVRIGRLSVTFQSIRTVLGTAKAFNQVEVHDISSLIWEFPGVEKQHASKTSLVQVYATEAGDIRTGSRPSILVSSTTNHQCLAIYDAIQRLRREYPAIPEPTWTVSETWLYKARERGDSDAQLSKASHGRTRFLLRRTTWRLFASLAPFVLWCCWMRLERCQITKVHA